jgi:hypothetical protein
LLPPPPPLVISTWWSPTERGAILSFLKTRLEPMRWRTLAVGALLLNAGLHVFGLAVVMARRASFPMDLNWMESGSLYQAFRFDRGLTIYGSLDDMYLPLPYPPVHHAMLAWVGRVSHLDHLSGRCLSIGAFAVVAALVAREAALHGRSRKEGALLACVCLGLLAASFPHVDGAFDLVRCDSLAVAWLLGAATLFSGTVTKDASAMAAGLPAGEGTAPLSLPRAAGTIAFGAALLTAAVFTKQTMWLPALGVVAGLWLAAPRRALALAALTGVASLAAFAILQQTTSGEYSFWTFTLLSRHHVEPRAGLSALVVLFQLAPPSILLPSIVVRLVRRNALSTRARFWLVVFIAALMASAIGVAKIGAANNTLIPMAVVAPLALTLCGADAVRALARSRHRLAGRAPDLALGVAATTLLVGLYDPRAFVPTEAERASALALRETLMSLPGRVLAPGHPFAGLRWGREPSQIFAMTYLDVENAGFWDPRAEARFVAHLRDSDAEWIVVAEHSFASHLARAVDEVFVLERRLDPPLKVGTDEPVDLLLRRRPRLDAPE